MSRTQPWRWRSTCILARNGTSGYTALGRRGLCRCAWHGARTRRHNDRRIRMTLADLTVDIVPILRPIAGKRRNRARNLLQQGTDLRAVIDILAGQLGGNDLSRVGVHPRTDRRWRAKSLQPQFPAEQFRARLRLNNATRLSRIDWLWSAKRASVGHGGTAAGSNRDTHAHLYHHVVAQPSFREGAFSVASKPMLGSRVTPAPPA